MRSAHELEESPIPFYASLILIATTILSVTYIVFAFPQYAMKALIMGAIVVIIVFIYPITSYVYRKIALASFIEYFSKKGIEAGEIPVRKFSTRAVAVIEITLGDIAIAAILAYLLRILGVSMQIAMLIVLSLILIPPLVLFSYFIIPIFKTSTRKVSAEDELPFFIQSLYVLSYTHLSFEGAILRLRDFLTLGAWKLEIDRALRVANYFGEPILKAFSRVASVHPSHKIRSFLSSLSSIATVKGTVRGTIDTVFDTQIDKMEVEIKSLADKIDLLGGLGLIVYIFVPIVTVSVLPVMGVASMGYYIFIMVVLFVLITFLLYYVAESYYPKAFKIFSPLRPLITVLIGVPISIAIWTINYPQEFLYRVGLSTLALLAGPTIAYHVYFKREERMEKFITNIIDDVVTRYTITGEPPAKILENLKSRYPPDMLPIIDSIIKAIGGGKKLKQRALGMMPTRYHANLIETLISSIEVGTRADTMFAISKSLTRMSGLMEVVRGRGASVKYMTLTGAVTGGLVLGLMAQSYTKMREMMIKTLGNIGTFSGPSMLTININPAMISYMGSLVIVGILLFSIISGKIWKGNPLAGLSNAFLSTLLYILTFFSAKFIYGLIS
ncbi:MAG: type II secretion system F family protein [Thermoplasmata archaeon]|nr:type II secretion system F family protein [Thermoplasmata archaeon]